MRSSNTGAVSLMMTSLGHTHTLTHYLARHSPTQDGRGHKPSQITIKSMAWLLNLLNFYHFNHVRYSIENESIFCIKNLFYIIFVEEKITLSLLNIFGLCFSASVNCFMLPGS